MRKSILAAVVAVAFSTSAAWACSTPPKPPLPPKPGWCKGQWTQKLQCDKDCKCQWVPICIER